MSPEAKAMDPTSMPSFGKIVRGAIIVPVPMQERRNRLLQQAVRDAHEDRRVANG
jgi:hypothetical protein